MDGINRVYYALDNCPNGFFSVVQIVFECVRARAVQITEIDGWGRNAALGHANPLVYLVPVWQVEQVAESRFQSNRMRAPPLRPGQYTQAQCQWIAQHM